MRYEHQGKRPQIDPSAWVAPTAVVVGDVRIGPRTAVSHGAILNAEDGLIEIGADCVIMENAVIKASRRAPVLIANRVLVGPRAYLTGCAVRDEAFLATGTTVFNHAVIGARAEVRINGVVHLRTVLPANATVPIGWVAVGDPASILPPDRHDEIWAVQKPLDFPKTVFGVDRPSEGETIMTQVMPRYARALARHRDDVALD
ncbi:MAG TPA: gamma carbonic anhydrase family protein [Alphaproteobacteria bacterium]|nr:gamma carbonic anhydrase family protein [Alphaproteobacteria bacterium]